MKANNLKSVWEDSYKNRDNFVFYPHEEVIRFISKNIRKRIGPNDFIDVVNDPGNKPIIDLGCGIGRHVMYCHEMGLPIYGVDLSKTAIDAAKEWARSCGTKDLASRVVQSDARNLPWADNFFHYAVSHGTLDSMPFDLARDVSIELNRIICPGGLFYCDLISGDDSHHSREFCGEEIVSTLHEKNTVQLFFNFQLILKLFDGLFNIVDCHLIRKEDILRGSYIARYHLVLKKK